MAPEAKHIAGPLTIRHLVSATTVYAQTVNDTIGIIQQMIDRGMLVERESEYAKLLLSLSRAQEALLWVTERGRILLGEVAEGDTPFGNRV